MLNIKKEQLYHICLLNVTLLKLLWDTAWAFQKQLIGKLAVSKMLFFIYYTTYWEPVGGMNHVST